MQCLGFCQNIFMKRTPRPIVVDLFKKKTEDVDFLRIIFPKTFYAPEVNFSKKSDFFKVYQSNKCGFFKMNFFFKEFLEHLTPIFPRTSAGKVLVF